MLHCQNYLSIAKLTSFPAVPQF